MEKSAKTAEAKPGAPGAHPAIPLSSAKEGAIACIRRIGGGKGFQRKVVSMGLAPGVAIEVLRSSSSSGPVIVALFGTRVALGHGMAQKIYVEPARY